MKISLVLSILCSTALVRALAFPQDDDVDIPDPVDVDDGDDDNDLSPPSLAIRAPSPAKGDQNDPKVVSINCKDKGVERVCNVDCKMILCHNAPRKMQKDKSKKSSNYRDSGAKSQPFKKSEKEKEDRGIVGVDKNDVSAEEFPFEGVTQGGTGALLSAVTEKQNLDHGTQLRLAYQKAGVKEHEWYTLQFSDFNADAAPFCKALAEGKEDICDEKTHKVDVWAKKSAKGPKGVLTFHKMAQTDKWAQGKLW